MSCFLAVSTSEEEQQLNCRSHSSGQFSSHLYYAVKIKYRSHYPLYYCTRRFIVNSTWLTESCTSGKTKRLSTASKQTKSQYLLTGSPRCHCYSRLEGAVGFANPGQHTFCSHEAELNLPSENQLSHRLGRGASALWRCHWGDPAQRCCISESAPRTQLHRTPSKPCKRGELMTLRSECCPTLSARCIYNIIIFLCYKGKILTIWTMLKG